MDIRALKALLRTLSAAGVTSYRDGDLTVTFGDRSPQVPEGDVDGQDDLVLPPGTPDPRAAIAAVYKRDAERRRKRAS